MRSTHILIGLVPIFGLVAAALMLMPACGSSGININIPDLEGGVGEGGNNIDGGGNPFARGVGERCDDGGVCRPGLACTAGVCAPGHSSDNGAACVISAECKAGSYCGPDRKCAASGAGDQGASCASDGDCKSGFRCNLVGLDAQCQPEGTKDVGGDCALAGDCFGGLLCAEKKCVPPPAGSGPPPLGIPGFKGVECEAETGAVTAHFRVPTGAQPADKDFFRLPFPNDILLKTGRPSLTGFPTPGSDLLGFDLVDRWARYLELTGTGWSAYPTVTFRFSGEIDFDSLKIDGATRFIDLTDNQGIHSYNWSGTTGRTAYVCPNALSFRPGLGVVLNPGHTYVVFMTNTAKAKGGTPIGVTPDLTAVLGATNPGGALSAAWTAYAPLRTWAAGPGALNLSTIINAAVFTVGKHDDIGKKMPAAIAAAATPTATTWIKCGTAPSPCAQAANERACPAQVDPNFDELHSLITLPNFQKGNLPYMDVADGGDFVLDQTGQPTLQGTTQVCASLTVPKNAVMPATGWPVVIYAHGTGGSFRSHVGDASGRLSNVDNTTHIAVLGIDQVGHGTRRGASTAAPQNVFFNFSNPAAARGNVLQGAIDQLSLVRYLKSVDIAAGSSPTGAAIKFDKIAYWGHSQGATEGAISIPYASAADVTGALFSGEGGSLIDSLLNKKSPINLVAIAPALLSEQPANVVSTHPALGMFQNAIDPADPLDHAPAIAVVTPPENNKHIFVPYGQKDTYAPNITQLTYVVAAKLAVAQHPASVTAPDDLLSALAPIPVSANAGGKTHVTRQYTPVGYDGHFVTFKDAQAKIDADRFLADCVTGAVPSIGR